MMLALAHTNPPHAILVEPIVRRTLEEDFGRAGDITSDILIPAETRAKATISARKAGTVAGLVAVDMACRLIDPAIRMTARLPDGSAVAPKGIIAEIEGPARGLLSAERTALNFLGLLSGTATATRAIADCIKHTKARVVCTRKTIPGLRVLQKYAVRCGGGLNHRFGLDDAVLVKDNHIVAAGGVEAAVAALRGRLGHMVKVEVEVTTLDQLETVLRLGIDTVLLDNMDPAMLKRAVALNNGRAALEASGNVTVDKAREIAETGVDYMSSGAVTHSAASLDVGLDFL